MPFPRREGARLELSSPRTRIALALAAVVAAAPLVHRGYGIFRADRIVRSEESVGAFTRALAYDPGNSRFWHGRGRLRHYSIGDVDLKAAVDDYRRAVEINPRLAAAWADMADCYERLGATDEAERALERALEAKRYSPTLRWQAGNFYLRRGDLSKMYESFRLAATYDPGKLEIAMAIVWKVDPETAAIHERLIPANLASDLKYLDFLLARGDLDLARPVWRRCLRDPIPDGADFKIARAFGYVDRLLAKGRVGEAQRVWNDALAKASLGFEDRRPVVGEDGRGAGADANLVWNGSFENEFVRGGFDWRFPDMAEVEIRSELANRMEGLKSLAVKFNGSNIAFAHLSQIVPIPEPGSYRLEIYYRSNGLTTDKTPYLTLRGYPDASGTALRTPAFPPTSPWSKATYPFTVASGCRAVQLVLQRDTSSKFDNLLKGTLWIDGVSIRRAAADDRIRPN